MTVLKNIPMDSTMAFRCARTPEPDIDRQNGTQKIRDGQPVFRVVVVALREGFTEVLPVKVKGQPAGLAADAPVRITGLRAVPWTNDQNVTEFAFWADSIEAASPARPERAAS